MHQGVEHKITEDWKKKIEMNRSRGEEHAVDNYTYEDLQMDLAGVIDEDEKEQQRMSFFGKVEEAPAGSKRQRPGEAANVEKVTRRGLRETLIAQANKLRIQEKGLGVQPNVPGTNKTLKRRRKGDVAITRLLNTGIDEVSDEPREKLSLVPRAAEG